MTTSLAYDNGLDLWDNFLTVAHLWMGLTAAYTPARTDHHISDIVAHEMSASGYARKVGASALSLSETLTIDTSGHRGIWSLTTPNLGAWTGQQIQYVVLAINTGSDSTATLLGCYGVPLFDPGGATYNPAIGSPGVMVRTGT